MNWFASLKSTASVFGKNRDPFVTIGNLAMTSSSELTIMARKKFPLEHVVLFLRQLTSLNDDDKSQVLTHYRGYCRSELFWFYSPELEGFSGVGRSIEDCIAKSRVAMEEHDGGRV